jgi:hypothetical protein
VAGHEAKQETKHEIAGEKKPGHKSGPGATTTRGEWHVAAKPATYRKDRQARCGQSFKYFSISAFSP